MSTIASPRASGIASPTSSRSSLSLDRTAPASQRRNRTALRDYYNLKAASGSNIADSAPRPSTDVADPSSSTSSLDYDQDPKTSAPNPATSPLDLPNFSAATYISALLASTSLEGILTVESSLISDIRGFDGERKALVYDNYSKLISATETISRMRTDMDPLAPTVVERVEPAVEGIAVLAGQLRRGVPFGNEERGGKSVEEKGTVAETGQEGRENERARKVDTVKWVLDTPRRFKSMISNGRKADAETEWEEVINPLLAKWEGVKGAQDVKLQVLQVLEEA